MNSIVTVTFNHLNYVDDLLSTLILKANGKDDEVIVLDNASSDGAQSLTIDQFKKLMQQLKTSCAIQ